MTYMFILKCALKLVEEIILISTYLYTFVGSTGVYIRFMFCYEDHRTQIKTLAHLDDSY